MFERFRTWFQKQSQTTRAIVAMMLGQPVWTPRNYASFAKEGYQSNVYVFACVRQIAMAVAGIPWIVYRKGRGGKVEELDDHPLAQLLERPNPWQGGSSFFENLAAFLMLSGNSYIEAVGPDRGAPRELYVLRPDRMKVIPGNAQQPVAGYQYTVGRTTVNFKPDEILHLKLFNPLDDWYGMSPIEAAARSIDQSNESRAWNVALLQNSARPPGALVTEHELSEEQYQRLKEEIQEKYAGSKNAGRPLLLEGGLDWKEMGLSPADMHWLEGLKLSAREIAIAFGVPPELIGDTANKTYCLPGDTRIMTIEGPKQIKDIRPGDVVWSLDLETLQMIPKKVIWQGKTGQKRVLRIRAHGRELRCSDNHPVLVRESYMIPAPMVGNRYSPEKRYRLVWKRAGELKVGDVIVSAVRYPESPVVHSPIGDVTPELMEFLGAMLGDGFAHDYGGGRAIVSMAGKKGPVRDWYMKFASEYFTKIDGTPVTIIEKEREFRFVSKRAVEFLEKAEVTGKAKTKCIPSWVFTQPLGLRLAFLRGLLDTDGSVSKTGRIKFASVSKELAMDARDLAVSCGIAVSNLQSIKRTTKLPQGKETYNELWCWTATVPALNILIGSRDPEDAKRLQYGAKKIKTKGRRKASEGTNHNIELPDTLEFLRIKEIVCEGVEDVYDITVEDNHNFFAEHICVHNSNYKEARQAFYTETVLPLMDWLRDELNNWLVPKFGDDRIYLDYDRDEIEALQEDREAVWKRAMEAVKIGVLTPNEARLLLGYEEIPGADTLMVPGNMMPLATISGEDVTEE